MTRALSRPESGARVEVQPQFIAICVSVYCHVGDLLRFVILSVWRFGQIALENCTVTLYFGSHRVMWRNGHPTRDDAIVLLAAAILNFRCHYPDYNRKLFQLFNASRSYCMLTLLFIVHAN
jgi:hypothetical protein